MIAIWATMAAWRMSISSVFFLTCHPRLKEFTATASMVQSSARAFFMTIALSDSDRKTCFSKQKMVDNISVQEIRQCSKISESRNAHFSRASQHARALTTSQSPFPTTLIPAHLPQNGSLTFLFNCPFHTQCCNSQAFHQSFSHESWTLWPLLPDRNPTSNPHTTAQARTRRTSARSKMDLPIVVSATRIA